MGWFDRGSMPSSTYQALCAAVGATVRVLAWGRGPAGCVVGLTDRLAVEDAEAWTMVPWQGIDRGGWDPATGNLSWSGAAGEGSARLDEPGQLPDLFRERVSASIVLQQSLDLGPRRRALITARRNPAAASGTISWEVKFPPGELSFEDRRVVDAELERLRGEYDIA